MATADDIIRWVARSLRARKYRKAFDQEFRCPPCAPWVDEFCEDLLRRWGARRGW